MWGPSARRTPRVCTVDAGAAFRSWAVRASLPGDDHRDGRTLPGEGGPVTRQRQSAEPFVPSAAGIAELRRAATGCRGCSLYENATQTVFGDGPEDARVVLIGEQPGDREDREGEPFVGPAGRLLDRALEEAGLPRDSVYLTNAVKHFKFERVHGKQR